MVDHHAGPLKPIAIAWRLLRDALIKVFGECGHRELRDALGTNTHAITVHNQGVRVRVIGRPESSRGWAIGFRTEDLIRARGRYEAKRRQARKAKKRTTLSGIAERLGVSQTGVSYWKQAGAPIVSGGLIDIKAIKQWQRSRAAKLKARACDESGEWYGCLGAADFGLTVHDFMSIYRGDSPYIMPGVPLLRKHQRLGQLQKKQATIHESTLKAASQKKTRWRKERGWRTASFMGRRKQKPKASNGQLAETYAEIAAHFAVHRCTITEWKKAGAPIYPPGPYGLSKIDKWLKTFRQRIYKTREHLRQACMQPLWDLADAQDEDRKTLPKTSHLTGIPWYTLYRWNKTKGLQFYQTTATRTHNGRVVTKTLPTVSLKQAYEIALREGRPIPDELRVRFNRLEGPKQNGENTSPTLPSVTTPEPKGSDAPQDDAKRNGKRNRGGRPLSKEALRMRRLCWFLHQRTELTLTLIRRKVNAKIGKTLLHRDSDVTIDARRHAKATGRSFRPRI